MVNGWYICVGKRFYGPGGPYAAFAGRDASRGLATFSVAASDDFDDLSDLTPVQKESVKEWETQFTGLYFFFFHWNDITGSSLNIIFLL